MGGLAARAWLRNDPHALARAARLITLGTPHHGTVLANLGVGANARQMRCSQAGEPSAWLRALAAGESAAARARMVSIWTYHDNIVAPQHPAAWTAPPISPCPAWATWRWAATGGYSTACCSSCRLAGAWTAQRPGRYAELFLIRISRGGARILIIEDNATNMELMAYLLGAFGHTALMAADGEAGVKLAIESLPDLILCDVHLPRLDGVGVVAALRAHPATARCKVLAVTALAMLGDRERLLAAGFRGYVAKPIEPEQFVEQLAPFCRPRGGRRGHHPAGRRRSLHAGPAGRSARTAKATVCSRRPARPMRSPCCSSTRSA